MLLIPVRYRTSIESYFSPLLPYGIVLYDRDSEQEINFVTHTFVPYVRVCRYNYLQMNPSYAREAYHLTDIDIFQKREPQIYYAKTPFIII